MDTGSATFPPGNTKHFDHPWLEAMVGALDDRLRQWHGVFEFSRNPQCLFRIEIATNPVQTVLSDGVKVRKGDRVIVLHIWNEQFPSFPANRPTLSWARRVQHDFDVSLRELAQYLATRQDFDDVVALCGNIVFGTSERSDQVRRLAEHFGFEQIALPRRHSLLRQLHCFGENILIALMILARNAGALRPDALWRDRTLVFLSRRKLQRRYGFIDQAAAE